MANYRNRLVRRLTCGLLLASVGCATPNMATLADAPVSQLPRPGLFASPPASQPIAAAQPVTPPVPHPGPPLGPAEHVAPASFVHSAPPPLLPVEAYPPRMDYLQQGPTFAPRSLPPVHPTATERMIEMQTAMEQLAAECRELKQRVVVIEEELASNQSRLSESRQEVATLRDGLHQTRQQLQRNWESFERLTHQLDANEKAHLRQLDEIIDSVRATVRAQLTSAITTPADNGRKEPEP